MKFSEINAAVSLDGLKINGIKISAQVPLDAYVQILGVPSRTIDAGQPAPFGYRNNQVHVFELYGIYLTEHHFSRMIESVNFVFDAAESLFPISAIFNGKLEIDGVAVVAGMIERDLKWANMTQDLSGEYNMKLGNCWVNISVKGRRDSLGRRKKPRVLALASICF